MPSIFPDVLSMKLLGSYWLLVFAVFMYVLGRDPIGAEESERERSRDAASVGRRALWRTLGVAVACLIGCFKPIVPASSVAMALGILAGLLTIARGRAHRLPVSLALVETVGFVLAFGVCAFVPDSRTVWEGTLFGFFMNGELPRMQSYAPTVVQLFGTFAIFAVAGRGGNLVVRGVLDRSSLESDGNSLPTDTPLIERRQAALGRTIGTLERWLLLLFVVVGGYTALGVLVAAKGFVRVRNAGDDVASRRFAEYVVIGTLASLLVAVALGLLLRVTFWPGLDV